MKTTHIISGNDCYEQAELVVADYLNEHKPIGACFSLSKKGATDVSWFCVIRKDFVDRFQKADQQRVLNRLLCAVNAPTRDLAICPPEGYGCHVNLGVFAFGTLPDDYQMAAEYIRWDWILSTAPTVEEKEKNFYADLKAAQEYCRCITIAITRS